MDRPALDTTGDEGKVVGYEQDGSEEGRGSIDGETDDVSVMTDETSDEAAERQGKKKTKVNALFTLFCYFYHKHWLTHMYNNAHYPTPYRRSARTSVSCRTWARASRRS
jgi:hypothetical protein